MVSPISFEEIEPYMDILAEVEHTHLNRKNPEHEQWLRRRIQSFYARGAQYFAYHDPFLPSGTGIISVLHEEAPLGLDSLGMRAEVLQIGVSEDGRRQGIGSILLRHVEEVMRRRSVYCLFMMTYAEEYAVISFYGKNGYVPVATLPDVYGPGLEGNVFMRKIIR
jgi:ribosomal protein S18 acetylase RimI-like enzyme